MESRIDAAKCQDNGEVAQVLEATGIDNEQLRAWLDNEGAARGLRIDEASLDDVRELLANILQDLILDY